MKDRNHKIIQAALLTGIAILSFLILGLLSGCIEEPDPEAPTKCRKVIHATCNKVSSCTATPHSECTALFIDAGFVCENAVAMSDTYEACLADIPARSCVHTVVNGEIQIPTSCVNVILFSE